MSEGKGRLVLGLLDDLNRAEVRLQRHQERGWSQLRIGWALCRGNNNSPLWLARARDGSLVEGRYRTKRAAAEAVLRAWEATSEEGAA